MLLFEHFLMSTNDHIVQQIYGYLHMLFNTMNRLYEVRCNGLNAGDKSNVEDNSLSREVKY